MRFLAATAALGAVVCIAATAHAQDADALNQAGIEAFAQEDYAEAARQFAAAYDADPDPIFRKSEAVAWFKAGRCEEAITAANAFLLQWQGGAAESDEAASVVANCKVNLAEEAIASRSFELAERLLFEAEAAARDSYTKDRVSTTRVELAKSRQAATAPKDEPTEKVIVVEKPPEAEPRSAPTGAYVSLATGGALVVAGAILHVVTLTKTVPALEEEAAGGDEQRHTKLAQQVDTARILVPTLYGIGGAALGLGVWLLLDRQPDAPEPTSTPVSAGFWFSGRY